MYTAPKVFRIDKTGIATWEQQKASYRNKAKPLMFVVPDGEPAVPCSLQSAIGGFDSRFEVRNNRAMEAVRGVERWAPCNRSL